MTVLMQSFGEAHVQRRHGGLEAKLAAHLVEDEESSNLLNTLLDGKKSHEVSVELIELILDTFLEHELIDWKRSRGVMVC